MARSTTLALVLVTATVALSASAEQQVYRYTDADGRTVYSDRPPIGAAKDVQPKRLGSNYIENDALPLAAREASQNYPVTLYTFNCGPLCTTAEALLNRRGVPYTPVNVEEVKGAERLKALTGEMTAPVLQVGEKLAAKGYNEAKWQALLDEAGYPKTMAPRTRGAASKSGSEPPQRAEKPPTPDTPKAVAPGSGYPKN